MRTTDRGLRHSYPQRWLGLLLIALLVPAACSPKVTESEEYKSLEVERDDALAAQVEAGQSLTEAENDLAAAEEELVAAETDASDSEARIAELEAAIEEEEVRIEPYPLQIVDFFVQGCTEGDPTLQSTCVCTVEELQLVMPLDEFFEVSVAFLELPVDPETGFIDETAIAGIPGADVFFDVFFDCLFSR